MRLFVVSFLVATTSVAYADPDCDYMHNSATEDIRALYQTVAIIGRDDRTERTQGEIAADLEAAQGRIWCNPQGTNSATRKTPSKAELRDGYLVSNATLFLDDETALVNRHMFLDNDSGTKTVDPKACYFEHIQSGEIIPIVDAEIAKYERDAKKISVHHNDFALVKLSRKPSGGGSVRREDVLINPEPTEPARLKVISNYASNLSSKESLTITTCDKLTPYRLENGSVANVFGSDCDTGKGSSAATGWTFQGQVPKLYGIVSGQTVKKPEGGEYSSKELNTIFTTFDDSIFELYDNLQGRINL